MHMKSTTYQTDSPDALYDCSSLGLAVRFGERTKQMLHEGRPPRQMARMAFTFAQRVLEERPTVIGQITPETPWGVSR